MSISNLSILEVFKDVTFSEEQLLNVGSKFEEIELKKGDFLLRAEEKVRHQYYVRSGCLRTFFIDKSGKEYTIQFAVKDWWISDYTAFFSSSKAIMYIEGIQDAILYKVSKSDIDVLLREIPQLEPFYRKKMEKLFASFQRRILANLAQTAKERYISFKETYPAIEQNVKNYHIASYLGITTESLSRIRKKLIVE